MADKAHLEVLLLRQWREGLGLEQQRMGAACRHIQKSEPWGRSYGLLANCVKRQRLAQCRRLLGSRMPVVADESPRTAAQWLMILLGIDILQCPQCGGRMHRIPFPPLQASPAQACQQPEHRHFPPWDTS